ncbi:MAG: non-homologous end-joining DNA ligase [Mycobacteriales bacterium]
MARDGREPLPDLVRPMLATAGELPGDEDAFGYELKWDGVRAVVYVEGDSVRTMTRNDREVAATYPELRGLGDALGGRPAVLDGEIVAFDDTGRPSFGTLQARMHVTKPAEVDRLRTAVPVQYLLFDLLHLDGRSTLRLPYADRRALLEGLPLAAPSWQVPPYFRGGGADLLAASRERGLEGVVAKRLDSAYLPGRRSDAWVKVKNLRTQEVVIGGWKPGEGRRAGTIGSLLLGVHAEPGLVYAGHVGTGFTEATLVFLRSRLAPLERSSSPFAGVIPRQFAKEARWVEPELVAEVAFGEWTRDGRLRHPSYRGLRADKIPAEVVREP